MKLIIHSINQRNDISVLALHIDPVVTAEHIEVIVGGNEL